jgi:hypothetical protein
MHFRATGLDLPATESRTYGLPREYAVALVLTGVERAPPKVEAGGSNPPGAARFDARKARSPRLIARRLETASSAAKAHRVTLDDEPDKRAGAVLKTDRRREALGSRTSVIRHFWTVNRSGGRHPLEADWALSALRVESAAVRHLGESTGQARRHGFEHRWHRKV